MAYEGSTLQVNSLEGIDSTPIILGFSATVPSGATLVANGGVSVTGIVTAASFRGDGSQLTGVAAASTSFTIAFSYLGV